jgi:hypothetical protein
LKQYIADFENIIISDSDDEDATQYFDDLSFIFDDLSSISSMIDDAKLIEFESNELFLTSFDSINNVESVLIISLLADKAFKHRLISKNITNVSIDESFDFTFVSIIESRYDDREFKNILINCDAARRSTAEMRQFTVLQRLNDSIKLDKSTAKSKFSSTLTASQS